MTQKERLEFLIKYLLTEYPDKVRIPDDEEQRFRLFRSMVNVRPPRAVSEEFLRVQNEYLKERIAAKGITDIKALTPCEKGIYLWQGDITRLRCGAVVNAANSAMLGCFNPCHGCIDNAIHTYAGVQLRLECAEIMDKQGSDEPTGCAKVTDAYCLPCDKVIHTVGPIVNGIPNDHHRLQLQSCYLSCLNAAAEIGVTGIAFCCISTGVFGYPQQKAAETAVQTVRDYLKANNYNIEVIFNVFKNEDYEIYKRLLS